MILSVKSVLPFVCSALGAGLGWAFGAILAALSGGTRPGSVTQRHSAVFPARPTGPSPTGLPIATVSYSALWRRDISIRHLPRC